MARSPPNHCSCAAGRRSTSNRYAHAHAHARMFACVRVCSCVCVQVRVRATECVLLYRCACVCACTHTGGQARGHAGMQARLRKSRAQRSPSYTALDLMKPGAAACQVRQCIGRKRRDTSSDGQVPGVLCCLLFVVCNIS